MASTSPQLRHKRVVLKLGGEAFRGAGERGFSEEALSHVSGELSAVRELGAQVAVVVGGGNLVRGANLGFLDRAAADQMGMLATLINGLALTDVLDRAGIRARLQSAVPSPWAEPLSPRRAREALGAGELMIFAGGTGNPYVTTDTAAAVRAAEIGADALLKATRVGGVYTGDPQQDPTAQRLERLSYGRAIRERLAVMDLAAFALCQEHGIPICVFDHTRPGTLAEILKGGPGGTWITASSR